MAIVLLSGLQPALESGAQPAESLHERIPAPSGFRRVEVADSSFGAWLRRLPLRPGRPPVLLYDGRRKGNQSAHFAVIDLDVGKRDLQQCADAVIRLRSEFLFARSCHDDIAFRFTSGDLVTWSEWRRGRRPVVRGNTVSWRETGRERGSYEEFRRYLDVIFTYAGTASLSRELESVPDPSRIEPGDVFIQGGFPGHAVLVVDVAEDEAGRRLFLLAQSFMPAQDVHVLKSPESPYDPWYEARSGGALTTPEWSFAHGDLKRFPRASCER